MRNAKCPILNENGGGKRIRTADIQLAKLALYQLSYAPERKRKEEEVKTNWHAARADLSCCLLRVFPLETGGKRNGTRLECFESV